MAKMSRAVDKRESEIKKKLTAAIMMLLVSCIMVVTSTYAWFTLSTAPEITGIQTTIGGNGNLEIALAGYKDADGDGILEAGDYDTWSDPTKVETLNGTTIAATEAEILKRNITWGNLVDLANDSYGLNKIVLNPSALNVDPKSGKVNPQVLLKTPTYGPDGRVTQLLANTVSGIYLGDSGFGTSGFGVRAVGVSSAMTERQFAFQNSVSGIKNSQSTTVTATNNAISSNGSSLANVAVKYGMNRDAATFTREDILAVQKIVLDSEVAAQNIETALVNLIKATLASETAQKEYLSDADYTLASSIISGLTYSNLTPVTDGDGKVTAVKVSIEFGDSQKVERTLNDANLVAVINQYNDLKADITNAKNATDTLLADSKTEYTYSNIMTVLQYVMNISTGKITVGGFTIDQVKQNLGSIVANISNGIDVVLGENSGIYYDIALIAGNLFSKVSATVSYQGADLSANVNLKTNVSTTPVLTAVYNAALGLGSPKADTSSSVSRVDDTYGFALDTFFRTNATTGSQLLLQTQGVQRIYTDSTNEETMGGGSSMTFKSGLDEKIMVKLMGSINVVFIGQDTDNEGQILATAKLDLRCDEKTTVETGLSDLTPGKTSTTKDIVDTTTGLVKYETTTVNIEAGEDGKFNKTTTVATKYYKVNADGSITANLYLVNAKGVLDTPDYTAPEGEEYVKPSILSMNQSATHKVTTLVYLDGETITNADVANGAESLTGTMNLQFSTDAALKPMDYTELNQKPAE